MKSWIQTYTGQQYFPFQPWRTTPDKYALAHQLANTNRFSGACKFPYSVAQHCVEGAKQILRDGYSNDVAFAFLMHDAAEPFGFGDLPAPIKYGDTTPLMGKLFVWLHQRFEAKIHRAIMSQHNVSQDAFTCGVVKKYDRAIIADEYNHTVINTNHDWDLPEPLGIVIKEQSWQQAKEDFITLYDLLSGEKRG